MTRKVDDREIVTASARHSLSHVVKRLQNALFVGVLVDQHGRLHPVERVLRVDDCARQIARVAGREFKAQVLRVFLVVLVDADGEQMKQ